jgi:hypothetical protein
MISNYFHDLAVALLATNILAVYFIGRYLDDHPQGDEIIRNLFTRLSRVTYVAFVYILVGGAVRAYFFREFEWNPAVGRGQIAALVVKHVVLVSITVLGIIVHRKYQRLYGIQR